MTRLTLSVPLKSLPVQRSVEGKIVPSSRSRSLALEEVGTSDEEVLLLREDFPLDCTGFVTDTFTLYACCEFAT